MPLQKSFSDTNHSTKQRRPQWQRNKTFHAPQNRYDANPSEQPRAKPPIPISSATKSKLEVFQCNAQSTNRRRSSVDMSGAEANPLVLEEDKENAPLEGSEQGVSKLCRSDFAKPSIETPATPSSKLALPELIGMMDVGSMAQLQLKTPDDRVTWDHGINATNDNGPTYVAPRRGRKRPRSSSPMSSPGNVSALFSANPEAGDLQQPGAGPGSDLWSGYAIGADKLTPRGPQNPLFAHLMGNSSSPQSANLKHSASREGTFKRSISCGTQFPKRRKVGVFEDHTAPDVFMGPMKSALSKPSRVSELLDGIKVAAVSPDKSSLASGPSSSSPIPRSKAWSERKEMHQASPLGAKDRYVTGNTSTVAGEAPRLQLVPEEKDETIVSQKSDTTSSDYGDFDADQFDESFLEVLESNQTSIQTSQSPATSMHPEIRPINTQDSPAAATKPNVMRVANDDDDDDDEFADSDEEMFAADFEEICSKYDTLPACAETNNQSASIQGALPEEKSPTTKAVADIADSDDEYGDDLDDTDFAVAEASATQALQNSASCFSNLSQKPRVIQRYLVTNILDDSYKNSRGLQVENTKEYRTIRLRDGWIETPVTEKAAVHVIGDFIAGQCVIDDSQNLLILHPDHLISSTVVADSFSCTRRAVLQDRVKATNDSSAPLVYGTILHEIFQAAMMANRWDTPWLHDLIEKTATRHLEDLYTIKLQIPQAVEHLQSKMGELQSWAEVFVTSKPHPEAVVKAGNGETATMCVSKLLDVEEHVWSPMYGLKGNIDATVQVTMQDANAKTRRTLTVPFEVKTGKNANASHRAQTALYNLLLSDRYDIDIAYGILYYMETSETIRIPAIRHELRHMIMQRNELACFVRERHAQLPPMLKKENLCNRCYAKTTCFIYHKLADDGDGETSGMKGKFDEVVKHLTPQHKEFFLKWDDLLTKEEKESLKFRRELWTMLSSEREKLGRCFSNVIIEPGSAYEEQDNPKINRFRYTLIRQDEAVNSSFLESQITIGEPIVISDEKGHFALANGYVTHVRKHRITVAVDRRLHNARIRRPGFNEANNQVFASIMEVAGEGSPPESTEGKITEAPVRYRLDKDEFSNGMATVRNNIIQIMADGPFMSRQLRSLIVDLEAPKFKSQSTNYVLKDRENINIDQRRAIEKVMSAQNYALVLGMPGTGKTTTIAHIIRALVSQGKSVLLTSYTHTAVDNILLKLRDDKIPILRLGAAAKINAEVQEFAELASKPRSSFEELGRLWHDTPVVATTCLGVNHAIFSERTFDYCIVDEASQITLPVCLGPIRMARTFVLVGDHNQLPPLVQNEAARTGGLDVSLFKLLSDAHPPAVVNLEHQYRMCAEVMALSNELIYSGRLKCGTPEIAARSISIPNMANLQTHHFSSSTMSRAGKTICAAPVKGQCWIRDLLDPATKACFVNTDTLVPRPREEAKGNRIVNPTEATVCSQLVRALLSVGVPGTEIGVMTHYRSQLALLKHNLRSHQEVEMHTCDRFQGRDKEVVVISLVRSNEAGGIGELLRDWRRINVAFTRAKTKLLVVGSGSTLKGGEGGAEEMVGQFVRLMERKSWVYDLPGGALDSHCFDDAATQASGSAAATPEKGVWKQLDLKAARKPKLEGRGTGNDNLKGAKRAVINERALFAGKPVLRDIMNEARQ
ncbi:hypothetical protein V495_06389 [Pseudogymnoascus sp. VKM F-4514 (FW-929)]|nr:hypothetical protein V495_06389 [Pseudogymnoascus sp. VKM F-4514 (FW-929)]KFY54883.1 hypothetical protein V497_07358 [Pseudogymnoascus sp. VKM F-4516 (FW-969)]